MTYNKPLSLVAALGFAASLACASAWAIGTDQSGGYEDRDRMQREEEVQPGAEREGRLEEREEAEARAGEVGDIGLIDKNRDRLVSEDEYKEWRQSVFGRLDADKDGELTELEYIVMVPAVTRLDFTPRQLANRFQQLDEEKTGKVSEREYIDVTEKGFEKADTNGDGKISVEELEAYLNVRG